MGLPWCFRLLRICLQCGRPSFHLWVGKVPWRREWLPTPVFLPGEFYGQRNLVGLLSMGTQRVGPNWATHISTFNKLKAKRFVDVNFSVSAVYLALQNSFGDGVPKHTREAISGFDHREPWAQRQSAPVCIQTPLLWNWEVNHVFQSLPSHHAPLVPAHSFHVITVPLCVSRRLRESPQCLSTSSGRIYSLLWGF